MGTVPVSSESDVKAAFGESSGSLGPQGATGLDIFGGKITQSPHEEADQGWEKPFMFAYTFGFILAGFGLAFSPDTSVKVWAREEALERIEERRAREELKSREQ